MINIFRFLRNFIMAGDTQYPVLVPDTTSGTFPLTVNFTGTNTPRDPTLGTWVIDFGDGNGPQFFDPGVTSFSCTYSTAGTYTVTGSFQSTGYWEFPNIIISEAPQTSYVSFTYDQSSGPTPLTVTYTNTSDISALPVGTSYIWDFGDGTTSTDENPVKTYTSDGYNQYNISLKTVPAYYGLEYLDSVNVWVPPVASFTSENVTGTLTVNFTDTSTWVGAASWGIGLTDWSWNFGDGNTSTDQNPSHTYATGGTYTVSLTVATTYAAINNSTSNDVTPDSGPGPTPTPTPTPSPGGMHHTYFRGVSLTGKIKIS